MKNLKLTTVETVDHIVKPDDFEAITLDSPATKIFTDFKEFSPLVIDESTKATDALHMMLKAHVHLKIVISEKGDFLGIVSSIDVSERHIMQATRTGLSRDEVLVSDLMVPRSELMAFNIAELERATVNDVVHTLKQNGLRHSLVMDVANHYIRGIISSSDIARQLHIPLEISNNITFAKIFEAVHP